MIPLEQVDAINEIKGGASPDIDDDERELILPSSGTISTSGGNKGKRPLIEEIGGERAM
jgi:hypothetical protein